MADKQNVGAAWFALCDVDQLGEHAIYHTALDGNEVVVWRADDGTVNVWENRCPHRGVRLSIGHHRGTALQCQYHGWQFGSEHGACRFVPAHPDAAAPPVKVKTWPVEVRYGFVWTCLSQNDALPPFTPIAELEYDVTGSETASPIRLRTVAIDAASEAVQRALAGYRFDHANLNPSPDAECVAFAVAPNAVMVEQLDGPSQCVVFLVQRAGANRTYVHGVVPPGADVITAALDVQRHHQQRLNSLRDAIEQEAALIETTRVEKNVATAMPRASSIGQPVYLQPSVSQRVSTSGGTQSVAPRSTADQAVTLHLARSGKAVNVAADVTLLQSLRDHGVDVPSSCEQGVCGTCRTRVLDGTPLHRDEYLTPQERAAGDCMMLCVSRAVTNTLTLDL